MLYPQKIKRKTIQALDMTHKQAEIAPDSGPHPPTKIKQNVTEQYWIFFSLGHIRSLGIFELQ